MASSDIFELDISERIQIVEDIWDSIAASPEAVPLTDAVACVASHTLSRFP